jgi:hypothetical protein
MCVVFVDMLLFSCIQEQRIRIICNFAPDLAKIGEKNPRKFRKKV